MTPDEHYAEAERVVNYAEDLAAAESSEWYANAMRAAQVHATLATVDPQGKRTLEAVRARLLERITEDRAVDTFRRVWAEADSRGEHGDRVRQALAAVVAEVLL